METTVSRSEIPVEALPEPSRHGGGPLRFAFLQSWEEVAAQEGEWRSLVEESRARHPFFDFDWFAAWYRAYCGEGEMRVMIVRDDEKVRAILPGMIRRKRIGGLSFPIFSFGANGHTPRCGVIAAPGDAEAIRASLVAAMTAGPETVVIGEFPYVESRSPTDRGMMGLEGEFFLHVENIFESPCARVPQGWEQYFASRSQRLRKNVRRSRKISEKFGPLKIGWSQGAEARFHLSRLEALDRRTWQHAEGTGLFSTEANGVFYRELLIRNPPGFKVVLGFMSLGERDASFCLALRRGTKAYVLKYGYDSEFSECSPGMLIDVALSEWLVQQGVKEIDMVGERSPEKDRWANHFRRHRNLWLIRRDLRRGRFLAWVLERHLRIKGVVGRRKSSC